MATLNGREARRRRAFSAAELGLLWDGWRDGALLVTLSARLGRSPAAVYYQLARRGGIAPPVRTRAARVLSVGEREEISRGIAAHRSTRAIARRLGRAPSTISREITRHGGRSRYRATTADGEAWAWARRPKRCRLAIHARLRRLVATRLRADWSPEQIAGWLVTTYPTEPALHVSHETIYRTLYVQARGALKRDLLAHLRRRKHGLRRSRRAAHTPHRRGQLVDALPISARPPSADDRAIPGHWEGDLLAGTQRSHVATLVERRSRYVVLVRLATREATTVRRALVQRMQRLPALLKQSLTWDRGQEMADHQQFTIATDLEVFFCDPHSPWQRGSNENTNGLLRQYLPKGVDFSHLTQRHLDVIARKLNTRPRETLGWQTPAQVYHTRVASTG